MLHRFHQGNHYFTKENVLTRTIALMCSTLVLIVNIAVREKDFKRELTHITEWNSLSFKSQIYHISSTTFPHQPLHTFDFISHNLLPSHFWGFKSSYILANDATRKVRGGLSVLWLWLRLSSENHFQTHLGSNPLQLLPAICNCTFHFFSFIYNLAHTCWCLHDKLI